MIACGNCGKKHADLAAVRACHQGETVPAFASAPRAAEPPDMNRIVTTTCRKLICKEQFTGPLSEAAGWACSPEHGATESTTKPAINWKIGERALYKDKRFEILEIGTDHKTVRLRTGGQGKIVSVDELQPA